jgi:hypothetical protein
MKLLRKLSFSKNKMEIIKKYKLIIIAVLAVLIVYVFFIRPASIRKKCSKETTKKYVIEGGARESFYKACVREQGLKE